MDIPLKVLQQGLFCSSGDFFIDAWSPVPVCIVTHAHGDHAYAGHGLYIGTEETLKIVKQRISKDLPTQTLSYGQKIKLGNCWISLHPAGHILGSSQIRIETGNCITVISGDYKRAPDDTCLPFEVVECDIFVTESTFALPIYRWPSNEEVFQQVISWWRENSAQNHPSILFCYALGKAQRLMSLLALQNEKNVYLHGAIFSITRLYEQMGISMIPFVPASDSAKGKDFSQDLILAPPSAMGTAWMKRFPGCRTAFASGWMEVRGTRRRKALDRGFVLSDHADWNALLRTIEESKAKVVLTTHGNSATLARYLREERNLKAWELKGLDHILESED